MWYPGADPGKGNGHSLMKNKKNEIPVKSVA